DAYEDAAQWPLEEFTRYFDQGWIAGAFMGEALVGMVGLYRNKGLKIQHKGKIWGVYVAPEARGQGAARRMIELLLEKARGAGLEHIMLSTDVTNERTVGLYQSLRFTPCGMEKHILKLPHRYVDDVVMVKFLTEA